MGFDVKRISSFKKIDIKWNSLILLDIDDTLVDRNDKLLDKELVSFFSEAKKKKCFIIGLTARKTCLREETIDVLRAHGLSFKRIDFERLIYKGCIFTNGNAKGPYVIRLLKKLERKFSHVVMVDDLMMNLGSVHRSLLEYNIQGEYYLFT